MEEIGPPILCTSHCELILSCPHSKNPLGTHSLQITCLLDKQYLQCIKNRWPKVRWIVFTSFFVYAPVTFLHACHFFLLCFFVSFFHFHCALFRGLVGACVIYPQILFVHSLVCQITHSFLSQTCINTSPMYTVILFSVWST